MIEHTYFGWSRLTHTAPCPAPAWEIDIRHDAGIRPTADAAICHGCPDQHCGHRPDYDRVTVRVICRSCDAAHLITGESLTRTTTVTTALGYGQPPRETAGLYLWPGRPALHGVDDQPLEYLVTTTPAHRLTPDMCVGAIGWHLNSTHKHRWWAGAIQRAWSSTEPDECRLAWARRTSDHTTVDQAAAWIADTINPAQQQPLVVAV